MAMWMIDTETYIYNTIYTCNVTVHKHTTQILAVNKCMREKSLLDGFRKLMSYSCDLVSVSKITEAFVCSKCIVLCQKTIFST